MKKKLATVFLTVITALSLVFGFAAINETKAQAAEDLQIVGIQFVDWAGKLFVDTNSSNTGDDYSNQSQTLEFITYTRTGATVTIPECMFLGHNLGFKIEVNGSVITAGEKGDVLTLKAGLTFLEGETLKETVTYVYDGANWLLQSEKETKINATGAGVAEDWGRICITTDSTNSQNNLSSRYDYLDHLSYRRNGVEFTVVEFVTLSNGVYFSVEDNSSVAITKVGQCQIGDVISIKEGMPFVNGEVIEKTASFVFNGTQFVSVKFTSYSLNIADSLDLNLYAECSVETDDIYFTAQLNGVEKTYDLLSENVTVDGYTYKLTYTGIAPQNIRDKVTVKMYVLNSLVSEVERCVWDYCIDVINTSGNAKMVSLAKEVLVYGGVVQDYLGYSANGDIDVDANGNAITSDYTVNTSELNNVLSKTTATDANTENYKFTGCGVRVDSRNYVYFKYFVKKGESAKLYINGAAATNVFVSSTDENGTYYIAYVDGLNPLKFADTITAELKGVSNGAEALVQTVTYSIDSFILNQENSADTAIGNIAKALYRYRAAVKAYNA